MSLRPRSMLALSLAFALSSLGLAGSLARNGNFGPSAKAAVSVPIKESANAPGAAATGKSVSAIDSLKRFPYGINHRLKQAASEE